jgi:hypothetical protein
MVPAKKTANRSLVAEVDYLGDYYHLASLSQPGKKWNSST